MKYLILGAGPAGLTFANCIKDMGEDDFIVLEKENEAGGLCRSTIVDGSPFDIGGGHFLDVRHPKATEFLFRFMAESEWNLFSRKTELEINGKIIGQPIEANIWQMEIDDQIEYIKSIAIAGCNLGVPMPEKFTDWIYWKLGKRIAEDYMLPYNKKMFGKDLDALGTYWLEKLPNVSIEETLRSCIEKRAYGKDPGHTQFYYPKKYGYGELWRRMSDALGHHLFLNSVVSGIDFNTKTIRTKDGRSISADIIISTIPWCEYEEIKGMPEDIKESIKELKHSSIQTEYFSKKMGTSAHWVYYPNPLLSYHRILVRHNFCPNSRGFWTETNADRIDENADNSQFKYLNKYAYPLNTINKPGIMSKLLRWSKERGVYGLGRWGEHSHYNSDVTVGLALELAKQLRNR